MPLKKGKTDKILHQNISELMGAYKKSGKIGTSKQKSKKAAQKQAAAIAYSKMDEVASMYVDTNSNSIRQLTEMYHEDEDWHAPVDRKGAADARLGHGAPLDDVVCECNDCVYWARGNRCVAPKIHSSFANNDRGERICECNTYTPGPSESEEAKDKFQELDGDEDTYGPGQIDDTLPGLPPIFSSK